FLICLWQRLGSACLRHHRGCQHGQDSYHLQSADAFADKHGREHHGEHRLQATGNDGARGIQVLQSGEEEEIRKERRQAGKQEKKSPLSRREVLGDESPGRIYHQPEKRRGQQHIKHDLERMMAADQLLSSDVVERERERSQQSGRRSQDAQSDIGLKKPDGERDPCQRERYGAGAAERGRLVSAKRRPQQHPYGRRVLQGDSNGHGGVLNSKVVEVVGSGQAQHSNQRAPSRISSANAKKLAAIAQQKKDRQQRDGKAGPGLGQYYG